MQVSENKSLTKDEYELWNQVCVNDEHGDTTVWCVRKRRQEEVWDLTQDNYWLGAWDNSRECYEALFLSMQEELA